MKKSIEHRELALSYLQPYLVPVAFESQTGEWIQLPDYMNFAARNTARLSRTTLAAITTINPAIKLLLPDNWYSRKDES